MNTKGIIIGLGVGLGLMSLLKAKPDEEPEVPVEPPEEPIEPPEEPIVLPENWIYKGVTIWWTPFLDRWEFVYEGVIYRETDENAVMALIDSLIPVTPPVPDVPTSDMKTGLITRVTNGLNSGMATLADYYWVNGGVTAMTTMNQYYEVDNFLKSKGL